MTIFSSKIQPQHHNTFLTNCSLDTTLGKSRLDFTEVPFGSGTRGQSIVSCSTELPTCLQPKGLIIPNVSCDSGLAPSNMVVKGKDWFNKSVAVAIMYKILHELSMMTVREFVQFMHEYHSSNDTVLVDGIWSGDRIHGRVWELAETNAAPSLAKNIKIKFYGGPPDNRTYYTGSLLTMLMDRVMSAALEDGIKAVKYIFPNASLTSC